MADSQEIKGIVEGVVARVFEKRISELRKDLHRSVGESLGSRVSELQLDIETGIADLFNHRIGELKNQVSKSVSEVLEGELNQMHKAVESGVGQVIDARATEIRQHVEQGMGEVLTTRAADLKREIEGNVGGLFNQRLGEVQKDIERAIAEVTAQRLGALRQELEKTVESSAERRVLELKKDVGRVVSEKAGHGVEELRKDVHRIVVETAQQHSSQLRAHLEKVVGQTAEHRANDLRKDVERVVGEVAEHRVSTIRKDIEKVVAEAGEEKVQELRRDLVNKVAEDLEPAMKGKGGPAAPVAATLEKALATIQESSSQTDILRALLDGAAGFAPRVALFVVKGSSAAGWQARGFDDNNSIKRISLDSSNGPAGDAVQKRSAVSASASSFDGNFVQQFGAPKHGDVHLVPLAVRDKVPALLYADSGTSSSGTADAPALQLLARSAGIWLELLSLRKSGNGAATLEPPAAEVSAHPPVQEHAQAAVATASPAPPPPAPAPAPVAAPPAAVTVAPADDEVHKKAKRFAKLLVDEIKLYNQAKVNEGRANKDLYNRLREDIEKSRASYDKRYGNTQAASADYFTQEIIKVLADNDAALLGSGFPK